jgi:hypothetical protein
LTETYACAAARSSKAPSRHNPGSV